MKQNKSLIVYHGQAQWLHLYHLLQNYCEETYVSCTEKNATLYAPKPLIVDQLLGYGPLSGIISALLKFKNKAIMVLACDLPLMNEQCIEQLISERDASKMATTFFNEESGFLEPLITIYEPKALSIMLSMLTQDYTCPRKMLMQNDIKIIKPKNAKALKNINFTEEKEEIIKMINQGVIL
jgi:molybdopterin-guanine dinucleotide biosynthesis protein A